MPAFPIALSIAMPVVVEHIESPLPADCVDLEKIYNDAPSWLQTTSSAQEWQTQTFKAEEQLLFAGRFNDRLIAAAVINKEEDKWCLSWLTVRAVTRDRCVGQRMVAELERIASEHNCSLYARQPESPAETDTLPSYLRALMA